GCRPLLARRAQIVRTGIIENQRPTAITSVRAWRPCACLPCAATARPCTHPLACRAPIGESACLLRCAAARGPFRARTQAPCPCGLRIFEPGLLWCRYRARRSWDAGEFL